MTSLTKPMAIRNAPGRGRRVFAFAGTAGLLAIACAHEERKPVSTPDGVGVRPDTPATLQQYVVADPRAAKGAIAVALGAPGAHGIIVDRRRVVIGQGEPRVATETTEEPLVGAARIPSRLGNGFLFWTANDLYRAQSFDDKLVPLARVPDGIEGISFAPKSMIARTHNGERWGFGLPKGERAAITPLGVADVEALDDGRALGFNDQGAVFSSVDHGAHWTDVTVQVKSSPTKVEILGDELWLHESNNGASRLERDGHLAWFDKPPTEPPTEVRAKDPRWRGVDSPLRTVFHHGAAIDERTAIVIDSGDVVRVDVRTGDVLSVVPGRFPPDAQCEAVPISGDVLFACVSQHTSGNAFVVSHTLSSEAPVFEQTFLSGTQFYASDDGGLAYAGNCSGVAAQQGVAPAVCVRMPGGRWEERDLAGLATDAGPNDLNVARWVPRADGRVVAVLAEPQAGIYDPDSGNFQALAEEAREVIGHGPGPGHLSVHGKVVRHLKRGIAGAGIVDPSWSFVGSALRGWQRHGESIEIAEDGKLTRSAFSFETVFAGALGLGRSKDGRLYQSNDHGATWNEVATPPAGIEPADLVSCTSAGCDLGAFYRIGWATVPPVPTPSRTKAQAVPEVRRVRGLELACKPAGAVGLRALPRTSDSPEDLGLGASRLPIANEKNDWAYVRNPLARMIVNPIRDPSSMVGDGDNGNPSFRAVFTGFATSRDGDVFTVSGPNKNALSLRRGFSYVAPFDPGGRILRTAIPMSDVIAAGRRAGMTTDEILSEDPTESGAVVVLTSSDPAAASDVAIHNVDRGLLSVVRGERVRVVMRSSQNNSNVISGVSLPGDESAFLEVDSSGVGHVFKVGAGGTSDLFDVSPTANETYYPANPDALAVGPKGDLVILRTPSGSDPASALDPAFLIVQAMPPTALAPWSELKFADDPACKAETGGYRAMIQTVGPWVRVTTPELRVEDAPMFARVRWTAKRVCLEGFEVKVPNVSVRLPGSGGGGGGDTGSFSSWLVGRGSSIARIAHSEGLEWRQPLECNVVTTGP